MRPWLAVCALAALATPASADEPIVLVPSRCAQFWAVPDESPMAWEALLSFAACIQDGSRYRIEEADDLVDFVDGLDAGLDAPLHLYTEALRRGPDAIKLRAAYYAALGQVTLMTRARLSLASPELGPKLEPLLAPHARLAYLIFSTIDHAASSDPSLTLDGVNRFMVRSAREQSAALRASHVLDEPVLLAR